jgi:hypothetical protein
VDGCGLLGGGTSADLAACTSADLAACTSADLAANLAACCDATTCDCAFGLGILNNKRQSKTHKINATKGHNKWTQQNDTRNETTKGLGLHEKLKTQTSKKTLEKCLREDAYFQHCSW